MRNIFLELAGRPTAVLPPLRELRYVSLVSLGLKAMLVVATDCKIQNKTKANKHIYLKEFKDTFFNWLLQLVSALDVCSHKGVLPACG